MSDHIIIFPEERKKNGKNNDKVGTIESSKRTAWLLSEEYAVLKKKKAEEEKNDRYSVGRKVVSHKTCQGIELYSNFGR